jgi:hypothetical protein
MLPEFHLQNATSHKDQRLHELASATFSENAALVAALANLRKKGHHFTQSR